METAHLLEQQIRSEEIYDGRILHVTRDTVLLENGDHAIREVIHHPGGACAVPVVMRDGVPYVLMVFGGMLPWQFISGTITTGSDALVGNQALISKVYFPRMIIPPEAPPMVSSRREEIFFSIAGRASEK